MNNNETKVGYLHVFFEQSLKSLPVYKIEFVVKNDKISFDPIHAAKFLSESLERYLENKQKT